MEIIRPIWQEALNEIDQTLEITKFYDNFRIIQTMISRSIFATAGAQCAALHHWMEVTKHKPDEIKSVIEFGGGFGSMCQALLPFVQEEYTIIDLPQIIKLQQWYLRKSSGVKWIDSSKIDFDIKCDMFIARFSLNEAGEGLIRNIIDNNFFGANKILFMFNKNYDPLYSFDKFIPELKSKYTFTEVDSGTDAIFK